MVSRSLGPMFLISTVTVAGDPPSHPDSSDSGSMGVFHVYVMLSPCSARPAVPPARFADVMFTGAGPVLSMMTVNPVCVCEWTGVATSAIVMA